MLIEHLPLGIEQAKELMLQNLHPVSTQTIALSESVGRVAAQALQGIVNSPSVDVSLKDGYAVFSSDVEQAAPDRPVCLEVTGINAAGGEEKLNITPGTTIRVLSGAKIPVNADAVLSEEYTRQNQDYIQALNHVDWTQYIFGYIEQQEDSTVFHPFRITSRLQSLAGAQAMVSIPEGRTKISKAETVMAQWLR